MRRLRRALAVVVQVRLRVASRAPVAPAQAASWSSVNTRGKYWRTVPTGLEPIGSGQASIVQSPPPAGRRPWVSLQRHRFWGRNARSFRRSVWSEWLVSWSTCRSNFDRRIDSGARHAVERGRESAVRCAWASSWRWGYIWTNARMAVDHRIDAWYRAFNVQPGDMLYLPPDKRVRIWERCPAARMAQDECPCRVMGGWPLLRNSVEPSNDW